MLREVIEIEKDLKDNAFDYTLVSASSIVPLDEEYLKKELNNYDNIFVLEENIIKGGFGSIILEFINDLGINKKIERLALPNKYIEHGKRDELLEIFGLKGKALVDRLLRRS